jgi:hypothetical protein
MTKNQFIEILISVAQSVPDYNIRKEVLENKFIQIGLSKESGYKSIYYYYNQVIEAKNGRESIFKYSFIESQNSHCILDNTIAHCILVKLSDNAFNNLAPLFKPHSFKNIMKQILRGKSVFGTDIPSVLSGLNEFYNNAENKKEIIEYIDYEWLPVGKDPNKIKHPFHSPIHDKKHEVIEKWLVEKKEEMNPLRTKLTDEPLRYKFNKEYFNSMDNFEQNFEQYLKHIDTLKLEEPEKYEFIKEISNECTDIELSKFIELVAISFEKNRAKFENIKSLELKNLFVVEQIELYKYANLPLKRFGVYATETFEKYRPVFKEALMFWQKQQIELQKPTNIKSPKPSQLKAILIDEQKRKLIDEPLTYKFNYKNPNYVHDYLSEISSNFDLNKKTTFGAVCLVLKNKKIFNENINFKSLVDKLSKYWDIEPPKDKRPNKYEDKKNELLGKYTILDKEII